MNFEDIKNAVIELVNVEELKNWECVKGKVTPRLVNPDENFDRLQEAPSSVMEDLSILYYIPIQDEEGEITSSVLINNDLMENYGISKEELHSAAIDNLANQTPVFEPISVKISEMMVNDFVETEGMDREEAKKLVESLLGDVPQELYVVTNTDGMYGANMILSEPLMETISRELGGDVYILPSSIHECLAISVEDSPMSREELEHMVYEVNHTVVALDERLSDYVYEYDSKNHLLLRADHAEELRYAEKMKESPVKSETHKRVSVMEELAKNKEIIASQDKKAPAPNKMKEANLDG